MTLVVFVILCKICVRFLLLASSGGFLLPSVAAGASFNWQHPASLVGFDPTLLICEKKRGVEPPRRSCPEEPLPRGSSGLFPKQKGPRSLWHPGAARYRDFPSRALLRTFERSLVRGTTNLEDPTRRKANFLWKFLCAGGASADCGGDPIPTAVPPQRFLHIKNSVRRRKKVGSLLGRMIVVRIAYRIAAAIQKESAIKNRRGLSHWSGTACLEPMGFQKGPQTLLLCCAISATKATSSRRLDTALLCAAKKRGVELDQLEGLCLKYSGHTWPRQNARRGSQGHQPLFHQLLQAH